jgi:hypothetical protein
MNAVLQRIHDVGTIAWVRFVQALNWIAATLLASVLIVHQTYPGVISGAVAKLPPWLGIPAIILFCAVVHYALRRAAKNAA